MIFYRIAFLQGTDVVLHIVKSGRSYTGMDFATFTVYLDGQAVGQEPEFLQCFFQFVHTYFLGLPSDAKKKVKRLAVKLSAQFKCPVPVCVHLVTIFGFCSDFIIIESRIKIFVLGEYGDLSFNLKRK